MSKDVIEKSIYQQDEILKKLHMLELKIALEIKRICEKNNIKYFLIAGTLLGAVRHSGFIPWDDDMDIGMLRSDYNRFLEACKTDLGPEFFLQTWDTEEDFPFSYAKVRLNGTKIVEKFSEKTSIHKGIFVDIFPYDNAPNNKFEQKVHRFRYWMCKRLLWIKKGMGINLTTQPQKVVKYFLFRAVSLLFNYKQLKRYFKKIQTQYNTVTTEKVIRDGGSNSRLINRDWTEETVDILFENELFPTFKYKEAYLEALFGDYMQLPPVEKRNAHDAVFIDFGAY